MIKSSIFLILIWLAVSQRSQKGTAVIDEVEVSLEKGQTKNVKVPPIKTQQYHVFMVNVQSGATKTSFS